MIYLNGLYLLNAADLGLATPQPLIVGAPTTTTDLLTALGGPPRLPKIQWAEIMSLHQTLGFTMVTMSFQKQFADGSWSPAVQFAGPTLGITPPDQLYIVNQSQAQTLVEQNGAAVASAFSPLFVGPQRNVRFVIEALANNVTMTQFNLALFTGTP